MNTSTSIILGSSMPGCSALGCKNRSEGGFLMKIFPTDPERRAEWALRVNRDGWMPTKNSYLCENHFDENQWERHRADGIRKLVQFAVPTVFNTSSKQLSSPKVSSRKLAIRDAVEHGYSLSFMADVSYKQPDDDNTNHTDISSSGLVGQFNVIASRKKTLVQEDISNCEMRAKSVTVDHGYSLKIKEELIQDRDASNFVADCNVKTLIKEEPIEDHNASDFVPDCYVKTERKNPLVFRKVDISSSQMLAKSVTVDHGYSRKMKKVPIKDSTASALAADFNDEAPRKKILVVCEEDITSSGVLAKNVTVDHGYSRKIAPKPFVVDHMGSNLVADVQTVQVSYQHKPDIITNPKEILLAERIVFLEKKVMDYANLIRKLRRKSREAVVLKSKMRSRTLNAESGLRAFLNEDQIASLSRKSTKGQAWSDATVKRAFKLKAACGSAGYKELLRQKFPFPSLRTLRRNAQHNSAENSTVLGNVEIMESECPD